jgi:hypothetical protein
MEMLVAEPLQSGYAREFLVARKGPTKPTKGGFGGAGARNILTNFDLLDAGACSREQGRASSQPEMAIRGEWPISNMVFNKHRAGAARPKRSCR